MKPWNQSQTGKIAESQSRTDFASTLQPWLQLWYTSLDSLPAPEAL